ncbi:MAG: pyrimidine/purine nucleoside phosphorylase [Halioglobus sp.]
MLRVNEYFDGNVKSIAVEGGDLPATIGVMAPGEYTFATSQKEYMTVIEGEMLVKLPDSGTWKKFVNGDTFSVQAGQNFDLQISRQTAYLCRYE